jgi:broad specificity phosphatase PhoE
MMCSPMARACETAQAIASQLGVRVELNANLCEVGGMYKANRVLRNNMIPSFENVATDCPSSADLRSRYPIFDTPSLPQSGPWDSGRGHEPVERAISRSQQVAKWMRSAEIQDQVGDGILILVSHADFIALLLAALQVRSAHTAVAILKGKSIESGER